MLELRAIEHRYDSQPVLRSIDLVVAQGEIMCLLGPSGCGKTTLLRLIAGLEMPDHGDILLHGRSIVRTPVHKRGFGLMFQDFALFPHMNVEQNVRFGLRMQGANQLDADERVREALALVDLKGFERRGVAQLSGGEKQRVALARSLAPRPQLLMLDEPLGSLDAGLRERLMIDVRTIIKKLNLTVIYVTHDQAEAFAVADRIALMNAGHIEVVGAPAALYQNPETVFAAQFLGMTNLLSVEGQHDGQLDTPFGTFTIGQDAAALLVHPDGIHIIDDATGVDGIVETAIYTGDAYQLVVRINERCMLRFRAPARSLNSLHVGQPLRLQIDPSRVLPLRG
ncbi:MAG: ABC transporter ATP-binding protein [Aggregatilineales bacterium]